MPDGDGRDPAFAAWVMGDGADPGPFRPLVAYDRDGDILEMVWDDESFAGKYVNGWLTLYLGQHTGRVVGLVIEGFSRLRPAGHLLPIVADGEADDPAGGT
jgi:hypothetical protein